MLLRGFKERVLFVCKKTMFNKRSLSLTLVKRWYCSSSGSASDSQGSLALRRLQPGLQLILKELCHHRRRTQLGLTVSRSLLVTRSEMVDDLAGQNPPIWGETPAKEPGQINASLSEAAKEAASEHRLFKKTLPQKMKARHVT